MSFLFEMVWGILKALVGALVYLVVLAFEIMFDSI
jgi:hypothetical protein